MQLKLLLWLLLLMFFSLLLLALVVLAVVTVIIIGGGGGDVERFWSETGVCRSRGFGVTTCELGVELDSK